MNDELLIAGYYEALYLQHYGVMELRRAAENPMFSPLENWITRFCRPCGNEKWTCPACGKKRGRRWFWTQLLPFHASSVEPSLFVVFDGPLLPALTPVCADHLLHTLN